MLVRRCSILTGKVHARELDVTEEQLDAWHNGALIQDVMPHLSNSDREFLINGITEEEWASAFGEDA